MTIRNLPTDLAEALEREKRRRGKSLNQTVIDLLGQGLGAQGVRSNGLGRLAGALELSTYCLDTSAYSNFRLGNEEVAALLDRAESVGISTIVLGELRTGFLLGARRRRSEAELDAFLDNPVVEVLPVDSETSRQYAEIVAELRRVGTPLPTNRHLDCSHCRSSSLSEHAERDRPQPRDGRIGLAFPPAAVGS